MTSLVTGASGFVGAAIVRALAAEGERVRALVRPSSDRRNLDGLPVEIVTGDITDRASLGAAVRGCRFVFHVAADYRLWVPDPRPMYAANVDGPCTLERLGTQFVKCDDLTGAGVPAPGYVPEHP